jgi:hypothetical protein
VAIDEITADIVRRQGTYFSQQASYNATYDLAQPLYTQTALCDIRVNYVYIQKLSEVVTTSMTGKSNSKEMPIIASKNC